jgi:hypothetical protein
MFVLGTLVSWPQTQNSCFFAEARPCFPLPYLRATQHIQQHKSRFCASSCCKRPATDCQRIVQVVPESLRSSVYAFDRCFEGAVG